MTALDNRYDFVLYFDVKDGNPNGDPDAGNMPRFDPETGQGLVTDVCIKRKIRNYVDAAKTGEEGYRIYVREGTVLNREHDEAFKQTKIKTKKVGNQTKPADEGERDKVRRYMSERFFDIRTFGAVMSTQVDVGQVRGPVQLTFARSEHPVFSRDVAITRMAVTNEDDAEKERTIGRKHIVAYGLYRAHGFISAPLAGKTGFSQVDLDLLWEALLSMFEHDRSAARGFMATRALIVFDHGCKLGRAHAHDLFSRVEAKLVDPAKPPRDFTDYELTLDGEKLTRLMTTVPLAAGFS
jgi:CRISPR-associated protein Csd2